MAAGLGSACGGSDDNAQPYTLTLLHINDHHSTLESKSKTLQLGAGGSATVAVAVAVAEAVKSACALVSGGFIA